MNSLLVIGNVVSFKQKHVNNELQLEVTLGTTHKNRLVYILCILTKKLAFALNMSIHIGMRISFQGVLLSANRLNTFFDVEYSNYVYVEKYEVLQTKNKKDNLTTIDKLFKPDEIKKHITKEEVEKTKDENNTSRNYQL